MSELREAIARAVYDIEVDNYGGVRWGESVQTDPYTCELPDTQMAYEIADKGLALVRTALLSDEAVHAGASAIPSHPGFGLNTWADDVRIAMIAMFAAAGMTGGQGDGTPYATLQSRTGDGSQETQGEDHGSKEVPG